MTARGRLCAALAVALATVLPARSQIVEIGPVAARGSVAAASAASVVLPSSARLDASIGAAPLTAAALGGAPALSAAAAPTAPLAAAAAAAFPAAPVAVSAAPAAAAEIEKLAVIAERTAETPAGVSRPTAAALLDSARRVLAGVSAEDLRAMPEERLRSFAASLLEDAARRPDLDRAPVDARLGGGAPRAALAPPDARAASVGDPAAAPLARPASGARRLLWPSLVAVVWTSWTVLMTTGHHWGLFARDWFMSVTMMLGSFVAGATSEGSGSISFPIMTLLFHIKPAVARDFALMIQSVGMTTAALTIFASRIPVEKRAILWGALGGAVGMALGATFIAPLFAPAFAKMFFASLWASFALAHWAMDRKRGVVRDRLAGFGPRDAAALILFGIAGGAVSSVVGTGLCMVTFTLLTLAYGLSEKVATPTSVVLMASNALFGFFWKSAFLGGMAPAAWGYWWVSVPIVVIGAPLGARYIAGRSRRFVSRLLYAAIAVQLTAALLIVPQTPRLLALSAATFLAGTLAFRWMSRRGAARRREEAARP